MGNIWKNFPVWFYVISFYFFQFYAKTRIPENEYSSALFIFPLAFFVLYIMKEGKDRNDKYYPLINILIALIIWGLIEKLVPPLPLTISEIKWIYEISNFIFWILLFIHAFKFYGKEGVIEFFIITLLYGFSLENSGIILNFFFEKNFHIYIPPLRAPLVTMIGWSAVFYTSYFMFEKIRKINFAPFKTLTGGAFTISLIALFWDMSIDPVASSPHIQFWQWNHLLKNELQFMGVPIINFVSWFYAVFFYALFFLHYQKRKKSLRRYWILILYAILAQFLAGAGVFLTMALIEGFNGPSWKILRESLKNLL